MLKVIMNTLTKLYTTQQAYQSSSFTLQTIISMTLSQETGDSLLVLAEEHLSKALEGVFEVLGLQSADLEELETDALGKGQSVLRTHCHSVLEVDLVSNHHASQLLALVLLLNALQPLTQKVESIWVGYVVDQHHQVGFPKKFKGDFLENVLACDVDQMEFNSLVRLALDGHLLDVVLAALGHQVVVVEGALHDLVH